MAGSIIHVCMADIIIHVLLFELFFLFEPDLDLRLPIAGSFSRGLPSFGAISLPGEYRLCKRDASAYYKEACFLKLMLSSACCNKFLILWDLVSSFFEVSFWAEALES